MPNSIPDSHSNDRESENITQVAGELGATSRSRRAQVFVFCLKLTLGIAIVYWLILSGRFDWQMYRSLVDPTSVALVIAAFVAQSLSVVMILARWWLLLRVQGIPISFGESLNLSFRGMFMGLFIPGTLGVDGLRVIHLRLNYRQHIAQGIAAITVDRALGFVGLLLLAVAFAALYLLERGQGISIDLLLWLLGLLSIVSVVLAVALGFLPLAGMHWLRSIRSISGFIDALATFQQSHGTLVLVVAVSVLANFLVAVAAGFGLAALGIEFSFMALATVTPVLIVIRFLPLTPLGLGVTDAAAVELYRLVGLDGGAENQMLLRATWIVLVILCGLAFFTNGRSNLANSPENRPPRKPVE